MKPRHIALALLVTVIWGLNYVVIRVGLGAFPPLLFVVLRFTVCAIPAFFLPRPALSWGRLLLLSATMFIGQFVFLFLSMTMGMPTGLASVLMQSQTFLTIALAALILREMPSRPQVLGCLVAVSGLVVIAGAVGSPDFTVIGLVLCIVSALCSAYSNVLLRRTGGIDMLGLIAWLSLLTPLPVLILSLLFEGPRAIGHALASASWGGIASVLYVAVLSTLFGYGVWSRLLSQYYAVKVVPFSLLVPIFGTTAAWLLLGEQFGLSRLIGMALIVLGLAIVVLPARRRAPPLTR